MCPNSIHVGSLVIMLGPQLYKGNIAEVMLKEDKYSDYDWRVKTEPNERLYCPVWDEELLLAPTNI